MNSRVGVNVRYLGAVGWCRFNLGVNVRYLGAVGWQPTALIGSTYWQQCRL